MPKEIKVLKLRLHWCDWCCVAFRAERPRRFCRASCKWGWQTVQAARFRKKEVADEKEVTPGTTP